MLKYSVATLAVFCCFLLAADDDSREKKLQRIEQDISQVSQKIRSDARTISSTKAEIRNLNEKISRNDARLNRLKSQGRDLSQKLSRYRSEGDDLLRELAQQEKQIGLIFNTIYRQNFRRQAALVPVQNADDYLSRHYLKRLQESYAQEHARYDILSKRKQRSEQNIQQQSLRLEENRRELLHEQSNLESLRQQRRQLNARLQRQVSANERKLTALQQEKINLEQLFSDIESRSSTRLSDADGPAADFPNLRGRLIAPVNSARLQANFGDQRGGGIVWDGLLLNAPPNTDVVAVASGRIAFSGPLKSMGNYIVIDHGDGYFSFYSAEVLLVEKGSIIEGGQRIASTGSRAGVNPQVYFGLRHNGRALNPGDWVVRSW